jgi:DHA1 family multidrug resistance protein-like MFS transporter
LPLLANMQSFIQSRRLRERVKQNQEHETEKSEVKKSEDGGHDTIIVADNGDDSTDPRSWSAWHRYRATGIVWLLVFAQGWVSTCDSTVAKLAAKEFGVSPTAESVSTAIFMLGLSAGALFAGPLSETVGRNPMYLFSTVLMMCFTLGAALSPNYGAILAFRLLSGIASSPSLSIYGGSLADLFDNKERRAVWPVFATSPLLGPVLAPVVGGWITTTGVDWRWYGAHFRYCSACSSN